jgi:succinoglycan biosynthesis protein ExoW
MFAVIIPFFQRQSGILQKALRSVFAQQDVESARIIVVDDQSPVPARSELASLAADPRFPVTLLEQANAGPGAARNRGLDAVPSEIRFVAFLDSDDEWSTTHLSNAATALSAGHDCYFADHFQLGHSVGAFARAGRIRPAEHPQIGPMPSLHAYRGDMLNQIITGNVIGTSTVVYDFRKFGDVRFRTELRSAGEDYLFWMTLAVRGASFAFSSEVEATYGRGVNVYSGAGWGTEGHLQRIQNEMQYRRLIKELFPITAEQTRLIDAHLGSLRVAFVRDLLHRLAHRKGVPASVLAAQLRLDPLMALAAIPIAWRILVRDRGQAS